MFLLESQLEHGQLLIEVPILEVKLLLADTTVLLIPIASLLEELVLLVDFHQKLVGFRIHFVDVLVGQDHSLHDGAARLTRLRPWLLRLFTQLLNDRCVR